MLNLDTVFETLKDNDVQLRSNISIPVDNKVFTFENGEIIEKDKSNKAEFNEYKEFIANESLLTSVDLSQNVIQPYIDLTEFIKKQEQNKTKDTESKKLDKHIDKTKPIEVSFTQKQEEFISLLENKLTNDPSSVISAPFVKFIFDKNTKKVKTSMLSKEFKDPKVLTNLKDSELKSLFDEIVNSKPEEFVLQLEEPVVKEEKVVEETTIKKKKKPSLMGKKMSGQTEITRYANDGITSLNKDAQNAYKQIQSDGNINTKCKL